MLVADQTTNPDLSYMAPISPEVAALPEPTRGKLLEILDGSLPPKEFDFTPFLGKGFEELVGDLTPSQAA